jgi:hypothetical protein
MALGMDFVSRCAQLIFTAEIPPGGKNPILPLNWPPSTKSPEELNVPLPPEVFTPRTPWDGSTINWQSRRKDEVNRSEGNSVLPRSLLDATFTEPYMVQFLHHNTLGAWWAGKHLSNKTWQEPSARMTCGARLALQQ